MEKPNTSPQNTMEQHSGRRKKSAVFKPFELTAEPLEEQFMNWNTLKFLGFSVADCGVDAVLKGKSV